MKKIQITVLNGAMVSVLCAMAWAFVGFWAGIVFVIVRASWRFALGLFE